MEQPKSFIVAGGTGRQGGAVVAALLKDNTSPIAAQRIWVITRNSTGPNASRLAAQGVNLITGELGNPTNIFEQLRKKGVNPNQSALFMAQAHGPAELSDAQQFINTAVAFKVRYFVYSSVDRGGRELSDRDASYCKTFSDKYHIEKHLIATTSESGTAYTILRPTWFADNALWGFNGRLCMTGWRENMNGKRMQVVVTRDIGRWAVEALLRPDGAKLRNEAVSIASDELTFKEIDDILREETGQPVGVTYGWLARLMIWAITDLRTMFGWINERDYGADLKWLSSIVEPTTFRQYVQGEVKRTKDI